MHLLSKAALFVAPSSPGVNALVSPRHAFNMNTNIIGTNQFENNNMVTAYDTVFNFVTIDGTYFQAIILPDIQRSNIPPLV